MLRVTDRRNSAGYRDPYDQFNFDKLFDVLKDNVVNDGSRAPSFRLEDDVYSAEIVVAGADKKDVSVSYLDGGILEVKYNASTPNRFTSNFTYRWSLPNINSLAVTARVDNGVLYLAAPKAKKSAQLIVVD